MATEKARLFELNFIAVRVCDFAASLRFYHQILGLEIRHQKPDWAYLETTGMTFELFGGASPARDDLAWGRGQAVRPAIVVPDFASATKRLQQRGAQFAATTEQSAVGGPSRELIAPENIRWSLAQASETPAVEQAAHPRIGWVELAAHDLTGQERFYREILQMRSDPRTPKPVLRQAGGQPLLMLRAGAEPPEPRPALEGSPRAGQPVVLSFETPDIQAAHRHMQRLSVPLSKDLTHHDWGGIDFFVRDADGLPVQVVEYLPTS